MQVKLSMDHQRKIEEMVKEISKLRRWFNKNYPRTQRDEATFGELVLSYSATTNGRRTEIMDKFEKMKWLENEFKKLKASLKNGKKRSRKPTLKNSESGNAMRKRFGHPPYTWEEYPARQKFSTTKDIKPRNQEPGIPANGESKKPRKKASSERVVNGHYLTYRVKTLMKGETPLTRAEWYDWVTRPDSQLELFGA